MQQLPVADSSFDIVTGGYALRNAPDIRAVVQEIARILKHGGIAAFLDFSRVDSFMLANVHNALLWCWGALIGTILHGDYNVYAYLARSLKLFPRRSNLRELFTRHGLMQLKSKRFFCGMIEIFVCRREQ